MLMLSAMPTSAQPAAPAGGKEYPKFNISWQVNEDLHGVQGVYPDPYASSRVVLVMDDGLRVSDDLGNKWQAIPGTSAGAIGQIKHVEFSLESPQAMFLASASKGVWKIEDAAKAPVQIGSKAGGLADDSVATVCLDGADPTMRTLLACHGQKAMGVSRSFDGGRTWSVTPGTGNYFVHAILPGGPGYSWAQIVASTKEAPDKKSIFFAGQIGDYLAEMINDVSPCDGALAVVRDPKVVGEWAVKGDCGYWATSGGGLIRCTHCGNDSRRIGPDTIAKLTSVGVTYGPTAGTQIIYAYEPTKLGMVVSQDGGQTFGSFSNGLYKGQFVKQGSHIRASAGGGTFFAVINDSLYVGRRHTGKIAISDITVSPPEISFSIGQSGEAARVMRTPLSEFRTVRGTGEASKQLLGQIRDQAAAQSSLGVTVTARLSKAGGASAATTLPADQKPVWVTLDASCLQNHDPRFQHVAMVDARSVGNYWEERGMPGSARPTALPAAEDVYGATCGLRMDRLWPAGWETLCRPWPGPIPVTITALSPDGSISSAVAVVSLYNRPETLTFWQPVDSRYPGALGEVDAFLCEPPPVAGVPQSVATPPSGSRKALHILAKGKPWSLPLTNEPYGANISGYYALAFWIRCGGKTSPELYAQLQDNSGDSFPITSAKVPLQKENLVEGGPITDTYRRVVVPLERILKETAPDPNRAGSASDLAVRRSSVKSLILSGDGQSPQNYWVGDIVLYTTAKEVEASKNPLQGGAK